MFNDFGNTLRKLLGIDEQSQPGRDNRATNQMVKSGKLPQGQAEVYPQGYFSRDNLITNRMVQQGQLPQDQAEIYPQGYFTKDNLITNNMVRRGELPQDRMEIYPQPLQRTGYSPSRRQQMTKPNSPNFEDILRELKIIR